MGGFVWSYWCTFKGLIFQALLLYHNRKIILGQKNKAKMKMEGVKCNIKYKIYRFKKNLKNE